MSFNNNIILFLLTILFFSCESNLQKKEEREKKYDLSKYDSFFSELAKRLKKENGELWNQQLYSPMLFVNKNDRFIIANKKDKEGFLTKHGNVYTGVLPKEINISNTSIDWAGIRWAMVMIPIPEDYNERLNLLIHELFHKIQPEIGFDKLYETQSNHLDEKDGRVYLKLELEALKKALVSKENQEINSHLSNALNFRNYRYNLYSNAKKAEGSLEINEGLCEYTGAILSDRSDKNLKKHLISKINEFYENPTFVRSFAYVTIPVYGYFMNLRDVNWNKSLTKQTNLTDYISGFFSFNLSGKLKHKVKDIQQNYGFDKILAFEVKRDKERQELIALYEKKFMFNSILTLNFQNMNISFDPNNTMPLKNHGTVYPNIRVSDNWGILIVKNGALLSKNWDKIIVTEPTDIYNLTVNGDGWELQMKEGWEIVKDGNNYKLVEN